ncbi:MAG TPA: TonB-dependent receptor [Bryobacteraceae bacterium]|jgi:iron complex outermembrane receptor protein
MQYFSIRKLCVLTTHALLLAAGWGQLQAQQNGTLAGTVLDQTGKAISGATVEVDNDAGTAVQTVTSNGDGKFSADIAAGTYSVKVSAPGFSVSTRSGAQIAAGATQDVAVTMTVESVSTSVTVTESVSLAASTAPSGNTLEATSARTEISSDFIQNFMSPIADYSEFVNYAPGTFSLNPNGIGLGQGSTYFRGFSDGQYTMTFDGIPFEDTNTPTHHSWANFPSGWTHSVDFDRSAGLASDIGPTNFGGSIHLLSPPLFPDPDVRATVSYGSWNTRLMQLDADSGFFGPGNRSSFLMDLQQLLSDGYQTDDFQKRVAGYGKYQYRFSDRTSVTAYGGLVDIWTNTPKNNNPTRDQVAQFGDNFLLSGDPGTPTAPNPYYFGYDYYHVQTDFEYLAFTSDLGNGWKFDDKAYTTRYWNKQNYTTAPVSLSSSKPSGVDKLNGYRHAGDTATLSKVTKWGIFRTGAWYDWAYTDRYQVPTNILTGVDTPLGNFHEHFITQSFQPFAEYEWHPTQKLVVTAGVKSADYKMTLNQYQDNGKTVGCLGGVASTDPLTKAPICLGGGAFVTHTINYNNWLPNLSARYFLRSNWSAYAQFSEGSVIPPSGVFDVPGGNVLTPPKPTLAKTYQLGSVLKFRRWTLDADAYYVHFQNNYDTYTDPVTAEPISIASGPLNTKGIEAESNIIIGGGLSLYLNGSMGSAKYQVSNTFPNGGLWEAAAPKNIETIAVLWRHKNWDVGLIDKRVGTQYNDNGSITETINGIKLPIPVNQAVTINPFSLVNFNANYTIKSASWLRGSKLGVAINNLADSHSLVGITPATAATLAVPFAPNGADQLNLLPGRSVMATLTVGWAPRR